MQEDQHKVSTLELFFDLVFVFTLTQLASNLRHHPTFEGAARTVLVFTVLYWMYGGYVWLTNQVTPNLTLRRLLLILGMAGFFVCALAIPEAFGTTGLAFGLGYLLVVLVHSLLYGEEVGWGVLVRLAPLNLASAGCVIAAGLLDGWAAYAGWLAAIAIQFVTPFIAARAAPGFDIHAEHFVERHGLIMIVALGESIVAVGIGASELSLNASVVMAMMLGLALTSALWWAYFRGEDEAAEMKMAKATPEVRFRLAINAYFYSYIPMLLGIVIMAAALEEAVADVTHPLPGAFAAALGGGVALYLFGDISFRRTLDIQPRAFRVGGAVLAAATIFVGRYSSAVAQLTLLVAILCGMLLIEFRIGRAQRAEARA
ncbi:MAG: low temperature requirement protein A [Actinomycetota bacterium]